MTQTLRERIALKRDVTALVDRAARGPLKGDKLHEARSMVRDLPATIEDARKKLKAILNGKPGQATAPTPERARKSAIEAETIEGGLKRHKATWPIDALNGELLTANEYNAAVRIRDAYWMARPPSNTTRLDGAGGGYRDMLPQERRMAAHQDLLRFWARLDPASRLILWNFVLEQPPPGCSRALTVTEFGQVYGSVKAIQRARGVTDGAIKTVCAQISALAREFDISDSSSRRIASKGQSRTSIGVKTKD